MFYGTSYVTQTSLTVIPSNNKTQFTVMQEQSILHVEFLFFFNIYSDRWNGTMPLNCIQSTQYTDSWHRWTGTVPINCIQSTQYTDSWHRCTGTMPLNCIQSILYTDSWHTGNKSDSTSTQHNTYWCQTQPRKLSCEVQQLQHLSKLMLNCSFSEKAILWPTIHITVNSHL